MTIVDSLLSWYDVHRRKLPWRETPTPYRVLLSELMLQQTRVETVIPYFHRFLERWPTLEDLAAASPDEVLEEWAGLGYYSRARNLLKCARQATESGGLPSTVKELTALPGIGPYTAGAVASIAFGTQAPVVDGNVERVLCRLDGIEEDPRRPQPRRDLWARAGALVPEDRPGDFNQALMELGATVCTPKSPSCGSCPVSEPCVARATGRQLELPNKKKRKPPKPVFAVAGLLRGDDGILLGQRPPTGLLAGLWEPVMARIDRPDGAEAAVEAAFRERAGVEVDGVRPLGEVVHVFTHRRLTVSVFAIEACIQEPRPGGGYQQVGFYDPDAVALSRLAEKILALDRAPLLFAAEPPR